ncbi:MAG: hypothetical protein ABSB67_21520 [Bryobacteraceae bacterium]
MLSWICPECGRENDPAFQECPGCTPGLVAPQPVRQQRLGYRDRPSPMPATLTFETDYVTAPCIDPRSLGLSPKTPSPPALARSVDWEVRSQITPARPACRTIVDSVDPVYTESRLDAPASTALTVQMTTALALAPEVEAPTEEFIFRTLALLGKCNPLPPTWCTAMYGPVEGSFVPDHRWVLGMESDLLHLMEALRESPNRVLLDCGKEDGPLPATLEPRALARKQDLECVLEYVPVPRALAPPVPWHPVVPAAYGRTMEHFPLAGGRKWPAHAVEIPPMRDTRGDAVFAPAARGDRLLRLWLRPNRKAPATGSAGTLGPMAQRSANVRTPLELRGFHENGIFTGPLVVRPVHSRAAVPGWMVSLLTALVIILLSTWFLQTMTFRNPFASTPVEASSPSDAAQSAFPTLSKYVEVTGVRVFADTTNSEIRYLVVNHSAAELPPFQLVVKLRPKHGPAVCSFSATVQGLGPNESREMRTTIRREVHSYDLPEWRDLRVDAHVTAK